MEPSLIPLVTVTSPLSPVSVLVKSSRVGMRVRLIFFVCSRRRTRRMAQAVRVRFFIILQRIWTDMLWWIFIDCRCPTDVSWWEGCIADHPRLWLWCSRIPTSHPSERPLDLWGRTPEDQLGVVLHLDPRSSYYQSLSFTVFTYLSVVVTTTITATTCSFSRYFWKILLLLLYFGGLWTPALVPCWSWEVTAPWTLHFVLYEPVCLSLTLVLHAELHFEIGRASCRERVL